MDFDNRVLPCPMGMMRSLRFIRVMLVIARRRKVMAIKTYGLMGVDWEERVNFERLRAERLARIKKLLRASEMGALLCFDMNNIRYITATHIGMWAMDKLARFSLLPRDDEPIM